jgi:hypothetical protein
MTITIKIDVQVDEKKKSDYVGPYGNGVALTDPVSKPKSTKYVGPYGNGPDQSDR